MAAKDEVRDFPGVGDDARGATDPDVEMSLGAELEFRGDVLEADLAAALEEAVQWRDKALRAQAEFENTRKRLEARHGDALLRASERVISELFPVVDDLERAIDHVAAENPELAEGLLAVLRKFQLVMNKEGVEQIDPLGKPFDPERHHAMQMQEDTEVADHTVLSVFQKGYEMHGRVLRPAMVVVSSGGPQAGA